MGLPDARGGLEQPGFQALLRLLGSGRAWAKLAGAVTPHRELDAGELLGLLAEAVPDVNTRRAILTRNPELLYGFA
jgi:predicted TIM-barrel fold metal-dependent hydrolase